MGVAPATTGSAEGDASGRLTASPTLSTDGVYQLEWSGPGPVRIEESSHPDHRDAVVIYEGTDLAATLSGRKDGVYYYRLVPLDPSDATADTGGASSESIQVEVAHHPLSRAVGFFTLGLVVFGSTVALVVLGDRGANAQPGVHHG